MTTALAGGKVRVLYVVAQPVRWISYEWLAGGLDRERFDPEFLLMGKTTPPLLPHIRARGVPAEHLAFPGRNAVSVARAAWAIARLCRERAYDVVHTHAMDACLAGLLGARMAGVKVRVHTRHHAGPYPSSHRPVYGALYDRYNNRLSTAIVAPSLQTERTLVEYDKAPRAKVVVIPHGFDLEFFGDVAPGRVEAVREKYGIRGPGPVVGVVARFERIKGVDHVVRAFANLLGTSPTARLVLANARGRQKDEIARLVRELLPAGRVTEVPFEEDMPALYRTFDVMAHVPILPELESFGQVYVEAMAAGVPCVCTLAGIAGEFLRDGENALIVPAQAPGAIAGALARILEDETLRDRLVENARRDVGARFALAPMLRSLEDLYLRSLDARGGPGA
jgi:glycosyltransferase involved in cell wall biosynthesis